MPYELQLNRFIHRPGWKYQIIRITDIALHANPKQPTSIGKKLRQAFKSMKPGRIYGAIEPVAPSSEKKLAIVGLLQNDPELLKYIQEQERNGYKVLLDIPKEIPIVAGKDTIEFIASVQGQRILRRLAKNNQNN